MAIFRPFKGVRYNVEKVFLKQVIAPPYDVISIQQREVLTQRSPYSVVNIDLPIGKDEAKYDKAATTYQNWRKDNILIKEQGAAVYVYEQEYEYNGKSYTRTGLVGLLKLEDFSAGTVFPHEKTLSGPKMDRLSLMRSCKANSSPIFGLYMDKEDRLRNIYNDSRQGMPIASAVDDDKVKHTIWAITDPKIIQDIQAIMKDKAIYIADGHHRYETALTYRNEMHSKNSDDDGEVKPYDYVMMMYVNFYDPGLLILPTHRVIDVDANFNVDAFIDKVKADFSITKLTDGDEALEEFLTRHEEPCTMVMQTKSGQYGVVINTERMDSLPPVYRNVDTYILEKNMLTKYLGITDEQLLAKQGIHFISSLSGVKEYMNQHDSISFILKSTSIEALRQVSESGQVMPQKSTFFYPKLATGLLFNEI